MEWTIVTVIIALGGFLLAVLKPLISLNTTITKLSTVVDNLQNIVDGFSKKNSDAHSKIFSKLDEHTEDIAGHETRITVLETHNGA